jgi:hypothetical protein
MGNGHTCKVGVLKGRPVLVERKLPMGRNIVTPWEVSTPRDSRSYFESSICLCLRLSFVSVACDLCIFFCYTILYCIVKLLMPRAILEKSGDASLSHFFFLASSEPT